MLETAAIMEAGALYWLKEARGGSMLSRDTYISLMLKAVNTSFRACSDAFR